MDPEKLKQERQYLEEEEIKSLIVLAEDNVPVILKANQAERLFHIYNIIHSWQTNGYTLSLQNRINQIKCTPPHSSDN